MRAIEAVIADMKQKQSGMSHIDVPEWQVEGKALRVWWSPLTLKERAKLYDGGMLNIEAYADVLIMKACDAAGEKLFDLEDKPKLLLAADGAIVSRVALAIITGVGAEDLEKNFAATVNAT